MQVWVVCRLYGRIAGAVHCSSVGSVLFDAISTRRLCVDKVCVCVLISVVGVLSLYQRTSGLGLDQSERVSHVVLGVGVVDAEKLFGWLRRQIWNEKRRYRD